MKFLIRTLVILALFVSSALPGPLALRAQEHYVSPPIDQIQKPYQLNDNLFYGYSVGGSLSLSKYVKQQKYLSMLRPNIDFYAGKTFSKLLSAKISLGYHCQAASIGNAALEKIYEYSYDQTFLDRGPNYSIHMANISVDGMLCLNRLFGNKNQLAKFRVYALAGAGINNCIAYSDNSRKWDGYITMDRNFKVAPELHAGLQLAFCFSNKTDITIQGTWHQSTKNYTGFAIDGSSRHYAMLTLGITKRMLNRYASYVFENCRGNEMYYFDKNEKTMLKDYEKKHGKSAVCPSKAETIISFPHTYPYITPLQQTKLEKMVETLRRHPEYTAVIDIYPYVTQNEEILPSQSIRICRDELQLTIDKLWGDGDDVHPRIRYVEHQMEDSPFAPDGIWFHNVFISYEEDR